MLQYTLETYIRNTFKMLALLQSWSREMEIHMNGILEELVFLKSYFHMFRKNECGFFVLNPYP